MLSPNIIFFRHGLTPENERNVLIGHSDPKLSDAGEIGVSEGAMELYRDVLLPAAIKARIKLVIARPDLRRVIQTSEILHQHITDRRNAQITSQLLDPDPRLRERHFGPFEQRPSQELRNSWSAEYIAALGKSSEATWNIPRAAGVETDGRMLTRVTAGILAAYEQAHDLPVGTNGLLLTCSNGSVMRSLWWAIYQNDPGTIANCDMLEFDISDIRKLAQQLSEASII